MAGVTETGNNLRQGSTTDDNNSNICTCDVGNDVCKFRSVWTKSYNQMRRDSAKAGKVLHVSVVDDYVALETERRIHKACRAVTTFFKQMQLDLLQNDLREKDENAKLRQAVDLTSKDLTQCMATCSQLDQQLEILKVAKRRRRQNKKCRKADWAASGDPAQEENGDEDLGRLDTNIGSGDHVNEVTNILCTLDIDTSMLQQGANTAE